MPLRRRERGPHCPGPPRSGGGLSPAPSATNSRLEDAEAQKKAPGRGGVPGGKDCSHSGSDWRSLRTGNPLRRTRSAERLTVSAHSAAKPGLRAGFPARARGTTTPKCKPHRRGTSAAKGDSFPRPGFFHQTRRQDTGHPANRSIAFFWKWREDRKTPRHGGFWRDRRAAGANPLLGIERLPGT